MRLARLSLGVLCVVAAQAATAESLTLMERIRLLERRSEQISGLTLQIQALREENQELRGKLEVQQNQLQSMERKQRDLYLDIDQRLSSMQPQSAAAPAAPRTPAAAPVAEPVAPVQAVAPAAPVAAEAPAAPAQQPVAPVDPAAEQAAYAAAYDLLRPEQRRYQEATVAFSEFLAKYPNGELAANAHYWLAEAYYVTGQNEPALTAFRRVVDSYTDSPKVPGAWLKIGYILHAQGKVTEAREVLQRVSNDYASSPVAGMARQRLDRIASERH